MERPFARIFGKKEVSPVPKGADQKEELSELMSRHEQLVTAMEQDRHPDDGRILTELEEQIRERGGSV